MPTEVVLSKRLSDEKEKKRRLELILPILDRTKYDVSAVWEPWDTDFLHWEFGDYSKQIWRGFGVKKVGQIFPNGNVFVECEDFLETATEIAKVLKTTIIIDFGVSKIIPQRKT